MPPLAERPTLTVPETVAPAAGAVNDAASGGGVGPFCTVTRREAEAGLLAESVTVRSSLRPPLATVVVFQANDVVVAVVVIEKTGALSTLS